MPKVILLVKARDGMSKAAFRYYYETVHAPLCLRLLPMLRGYTRNYVDHERSNAAGARCPYDVVTEFAFDSDEDYRAFQAAMEDPAIRDPIRSDEPNFVDPPTIAYLEVDEQQSA